MLYADVVEARSELVQKYDDDFLGRICLEIFNYHYDTDIEYVLDDEANKEYEKIYNKYCTQYNLKYTGEIIRISICTHSFYIQGNTSV